MTSDKCRQCGFDITVENGCPGCGARQPTKTWTHVVLRRYVTMTMVPIYVVALVVLVAVMLGTGP